MKKSSIALLTLSLGVVALSVSACGSMKVPGVKSVEKNVLTNLPGGNGKILMVKVDDTSSAHPQIGIASADIVYIEQVEGGLTRLAAFFTDPTKLPDLIGPVRSARISDIDIAASFGRVAFAYSGEQTRMRPVIAAANVENLSAERESSLIYSRDSMRPAPTNLILHAKDLLYKAEQDGKSIDSVKSIGLTFGEVPKNGKIIESVKFSWPASRYSATWSKVERRWLLGYAGSPNLDANGLQLGPQNLILQKVPITESIYHDKFGGVTPLSTVTGSGTGYLLRDGKVFTVYWNRATPADKTAWTTKDGSPANIADGQTWIALLDKEPLFGFPVTNTPAPAPSKSK